MGHGENRSAKLKVRDKARKRRLKLVRNFVQFVWKDKRVFEWSSKLLEMAELNKNQEKQPEHRKKLFKVGETGGFCVTEMED